MKILTILRGLIDENPLSQADLEDLLEIDSLAASLAKMSGVRDKSAKSDFDQLLALLDSLGATATQPRKTVDSRHFGPSRHGKDHLNIHNVDYFSLF